MPPPVPESRSETFYKRQYELSCASNSHLQTRLRDAETRNANLLKSLYNLSLSSSSTPVSILSSLHAPPSSPAPPPPPSPPSSSMRFYRLFSAHSSAIYSSVFSPSLSHIATCSFDRSIRLHTPTLSWSSSPLTLAHVFNDAHRAPVVALCWNTGGLVSGGLDGDVVGWDVEAGLEKWRKRIGGGVVRAMCEVKGGVMVGMSDGGLWIVDDRGKESCQRRKGEGVIGLCADGHGEVLAVERGGKVRRWGNGDVVSEGNEAGGVWAGGDLTVVSGRDGFVRVYEDDEVVEWRKGTAGLTGWVKNGEVHMAWGRDKEVWASQCGGEEWRVGAHDGRVYGVAVASKEGDQERLGVSWSSDGGVAIWGL